MKKCPFCSEEIQDSAVKCRYCGEWIEKKDEPILNKDVSGRKVTTLPELSPRPTPEQSIVTEPPIKETKVKIETLYEAFLGEKNNIYYLNKFNEFDRQPSKLNASWNWAAFFGFGAWALYRKMYVWFFTVWGVITLSALFEKGGSLAISLFIYTITWILFAIFANALYHHNAKKKIAAAQSLITGESKLIEFLKRKGGVNRWVIWAALCVSIGGILAALIIPLYIAPISKKEPAPDYSAPSPVPESAPAPAPEAAPAPAPEAATAPAPAIINTRPDAPYKWKYNYGDGRTAYVREDGSFVVYRTGESDNVVPENAEQFKTKESKINRKTESEEDRVSEANRNLSSCIRKVNKKYEDIFANLPSAISIQKFKKQDELEEQKNEDLNKCYESRFK